MPPLKRQNPGLRFAYTRTKEPRAPVVAVELDGGRRLELDVGNRADDIMEQVLRSRDVKDAAAFK